MPKGTIRLHRVFRTNPERVYQAFLDADAMAKWLPPYGFTCKVHHMDAKVGGTYKMSLTEVREHRLRTFSDAGNEVGSLVDPPEQRSIVHDVPDPVCNLLEPDVLVTEGIAEKGLRGVQAESTAVADTTDLHMVGILRRNEPLGIGTRRRLPERCRHLIADAFVGSLLIVAPAEGVELPLLAAQGARRRPRRLALELAVHAFMGRVLLGTRRMNPLMDDAELHPPHVQPAQAVDARRRERCPVVGPDRFGEADLSEQGAEHGLRRLGLHRRQAAAREERPAEVIGDREPG